ncbi:unnamed protein product [Microthlaspi erraticum]|uniref:Reverse transcriptase domain-containing protein n=1 Tax=Microthlaspi erraticum TaxID=1685480 RepID=A0A6D2L3A8_9BRAS|nr:unnamed protein product [Microthlaspi erraticum]
MRLSWCLVRSISEATIIADYYEDLFTAVQEPRRRSIVEQTLSPSTVEIKEALFSIHPDKAPGPDGFSAYFFQTHWDVVEEAIVKEVGSFFSSGILPASINNTHVRLIPKITSPKGVSDYKPIALCNVYYKIISKVLTRRLQPLLDGIIAENQSAFVPGRAISDNVMITHEVLHFLKISGAKKHCSMAVKTDMSKAYDRVEWDFLYTVQQRMGFHPRWINWIHQCVSTVNYSYLVNDNAHGAISPGRGIRQGDPLSPYLFILCGEVLSGLCRKAQLNGSLPGIKVARRSPPVNHLLFADDTMFFCKASKKNCKTLVSILKNYEIASGQKINVEKSSITFANKTNGEIKAMAAEILGISKTGGQGKYLGLPEHFGRRKKDLFSIIVDRIRNKSVSWSTKFLSGAGKMTMLKSVLSAMPTYTMSCFKLPQSLCKRIQSAMTRFWWDDNKGNKKICWVAYKLTKSKRDGGLGFRDIQAFNDALLAKLSWRILMNPQCLLARILLRKYCKHNTFLEVKGKQTASHGWQSILIGRDLLKTNLGRAIGNGEDINIWREPWMSLEKPLAPIGPAHQNTENLTVSELWNKQSRSWNKERIRALLPQWESEILLLKPSCMRTQDKLIWLQNPSGEYTTKSGYHQAISLQHQQENILVNTSINWNVDVWNSKASPKLKMFLWKLTNGALAIGVNLLGRGIQANVTCIRCGELETKEHLLFHCDFAKQTWKMIPVTTTVDHLETQSFALSLKEARDWICLPPIGLAKGTIFAWVCWGLWLARNHKIFENRSFSPLDTATKALADAREWQAAQPQGKERQNRRATHGPPRQHNHQITAFVDAVWRQDNQTAGFGWVIINANETEISRGHKAEPFVRSPLAAEALALREALLYAKVHDLNNLCFKSDSQTLIRAILNRDQVAEIYGILQDIHQLASTFESILFSFTPRSSNLVADSLAKFALSHFVLNAL